MKKWVKLLMLLLWMGLIFFFSAQPAPESEETSNLVAEIVYKIYSFVMAGGGKLSQSEFMARYIQPIRKLAHFSEFMILAILIFINVIEYRKRNVYLVSFVLGTLYAVSDEIHQLFVMNRYCSIYDMMIDASGCLLGIIICHLFYERWKKAH
ncbi:MAG: VanZ family protein [Erysipelotrichaceae bacterium]|nr:VanZ family protein [Erysipelotrichaceae bacterium]